MSLPSLLVLPNESAYQLHFEKHYVNTSPLVTFDDMQIRFSRHNFSHAFFTGSVRRTRRKDRFDTDRAKRMDWIAAVLQDRGAELYRRVMRISRRPRRGTPKSALRRIALIPSERYAVVVDVEKRNPKRANFVTAYVVNSDAALAKMRSNPRW